MKHVRSNVDTKKSKNSEDLRVKEGKWVALRSSRIFLAFFLG
jgi:hypothetical protein